MFRAMALEVEAPTSGEPAITARAAATDLLVDDTSKLLMATRAARYRKLTPKLIAFRAAHPEVDEKQLARMLADPHTETAALAVEASQLRATITKTKGVEAFERDVEAYNQAIGKAKQDLETWFKANADQLPENASLKDVLAAAPPSLRSEFERLAAERKRLGAQEKELGGRVAQAQSLEARRKLLSEVDGIRGEMQGVAAIADDLDAIRREFIRLNATKPSGSIKTPSVVLSWDSKEIGSVGGHNLDARALRLEPAADVADIAVVQTKTGVILKYNPAKADAVAEHAGALARAVEHEGVTTSADLTKMIDAPIAQRTRAVALETSNRPKAEELFGRLGLRTYSEKTAFVEDLRSIAEKNECCTFIARDERQIAYIAEKNLSPPPTVRVLEVRDTPSLSSSLQVRAVNGRRALVFLDQPESHVQALTLGLGATQETSAGIGGLARMLGQKTRNLVSAIGDMDLRGRPAYLRASEVGGGAKPLALERLGLIHPKEAWRGAQTRVLEQNAAQAIVGNAGWEPARDGVPTAVVVSFGPTGSVGGPLDVTIVAGFDAGNVEAGAGRLRTVHRDVIASVESRGGTVGQYCMTVKNELQKLSDLQMKRLLFVVEEGLTKGLFTRALRSEDPLAPI